MAKFRPNGAVSVCVNLAPISDIISKFSDMTFPPMALGQFCTTVTAFASDELSFVACQAHHMCLVHGPRFEFYSPEVDNQHRDSPSWLLAPLIHVSLC